MSEGGRSRLQWVELVTTIGIVVSLVFVGLEIRQNTSVARAQARIDMATITQDWLLVLAQDPALTRAFDLYWNEERSELTAVDESQAQRAMIALLRRLEAAYLLYQEELIPEQALGSYGVVSPYLGRPLLGSYGVVSPYLGRPRFQDEFWPNIRGGFDETFVRFIEAIWESRGSGPAS